MAMDFLSGDPIKALQQIGKRADEEAREKTKGFEVGYELFSINGKMFGLVSRCASSLANAYCFTC